MPALSPGLSLGCAGGYELSARAVKSFGSGWEPEG